jgi:hypothetical protein
MKTNVILDFQSAQPKDFNCGKTFRRPVIGNKKSESAGLMSAAMTKPPQNP